MNRKLLHSQRQRIEVVDVIAPEVQCCIHFLWKGAVGYPETHILWLGNAGTLHGTLNLSFGRGKVDPGDILAIFRFLSGGYSDSSHIGLIVIAGQVLSIIEL